jgi:DNA-binding HxlR family transcriptional regulator
MGKCDVVEYSLTALGKDRSVALESLEKWGDRNRAELVGRNC